MSDCSSECSFLTIGEERLRAHVSYYPQLCFKSKSKHLIRGPTLNCKQPRSFVSSPRCCNWIRLVFLLCVFPHSSKSFRLTYARVNSLRSEADHLRRRFFTISVKKKIGMHYHLLAFIIIYYQSQLSPEKLKVRDNSKYSE